MPSTILVVEDCSAVRAFLARVLRLHGYDVLEAVHGLDAIDQAENHPGSIDVLLTDLSMPYMPGTVLAQRLCSSYPDLRVVIMTGHVSQTAELADDWGIIDKPFTPNALLNKLEEVRGYCHTPSVYSQTDVRVGS